MATVGVKGLAAVNDGKCTTRGHDSSFLIPIRLVLRSLETDSRSRVVDEAIETYSARTATVATSV